MSQVVTRRNISEIESLSITGINAGWSVGAVVVPAMAFIGRAAIRELVTGSVDLQTVRLENSASDLTLLSPSELRSKFAACYKAEMDALVMKEALSDVTQKAAVVRTLAQVNYQVENREAVEEKLQAIVNAPAMRVNKQVESLMNEVERQHTNIFTKQLAEVVSQASREAGFKNVEVEYHDTLPHIVAMDDTGRAVRSEVKLNPNSRVLDLVSETIGVSDGNCNRIMEDFSRALERHGLKSSPGGRKWTGGQCWLPGSKEVECKMRNKQRQKQLERARTLNRRNKNRVQGNPS